MRKNKKKMFLSSLSRCVAQLCSVFGNVGLSLPVASPPVSHVRHRSWSAGHRGCAGQCLSFTYQVKGQVDVIENPFSIKLLVVPLHELILAELSRKLN